MAQTSRHGAVEQSYLRRLGAVASTLLGVGFWFTAFVFGAATYSALANDTMWALWKAGSFLWKFSIAIYFTSWVLGVKFDKDRELEIYRSAPREGRIDAGSAALALFIFVLFGIMYLVEDIGYTSDAAGSAPRSFLAAWLLNMHMVSGYHESILYDCRKYGDITLFVFINVLWFFNVFIWRYFVKHFIKPMEAASRQIYREEENHFGLEKIHVFNRYIDGRWQWHRFACGSAYLLLLDVMLVLVLTTHVFGVAVDPQPESASAGLGASGPERITLAVLFAGFVIGVEGWIWIERLRTKFALSSIDGMSHRYDLSPHRATHRRRPPH